jgi:hypothetical protein
MSPVSPTDSVFTALQSFARDVKSKAALGERFNEQPEDHLKGSVTTLIEAVGGVLAMQVEAIPEARVDDVGGRPDLAVTVDGLLVGYIELKAPGVGTTDRELRDRNRTQLRKFLNLPNLIYIDARDWTFYTNGERNRSHDLRLGDIDETHWTWEMTRELQNLLWVLEGVIALEPTQAELLDEIVAGELFLGEELPTPTDAEQQAPRVERQQQLGLDLGI